VKVVIDTNVLISGIFSGGAPDLILRAWRKGQLELIISEQILEEYLTVCERISQRYPSVDVRDILLLIAQNSTLVDSPDLPDPISSDPDDDKFLACAIAGATRIIISGYSDLLAVSGYQAVRVIKPRAFIGEHLT
jgi:putative PIN family toxin of toxin-antitoxin system